LAKKELNSCADNKMLKFVYSNIKYPNDARKKGIQGKVYLQFVIDKDGTVDDINVLRDPGGGLGDEAKRVIQLMNDQNIKWKPGMQRGKPVKVRYTLPIKFSL